MWSVLLVDQDGIRFYVPTIEKVYSIVDLFESKHFTVKWVNDYPDFD